MRQGYFIVVLAHSIHGRLRRIHVPHQFVYVILALAFFGAISLFGMVSSYVRMFSKVSNYNELRTEMDTLRARYQMLQRESKQKDQNLASLQLLASEVQLALGVKRQIEGPADMAFEAPLVPSFKESLQQYNFLKSASFSRLHRGYLNQFMVNNKPNLWPVNGRINSSFGRRSDPFSGEGAYHPGVDLEAPMGTPVRCAADGVVRIAEWQGAYGRAVVIDHGGGVQTLYGHLSRFSVLAGQPIRRGEVIGYSGNTGRASGAHLHYEVRVGGTPVNPYHYLSQSQRTVASAKQPTSSLPF
jgi:murein DD-endopeptidase MepM/ murein hydrolase activator NlpD